MDTQSSSLDLALANSCEHTPLTPLDSTEGTESSVGSPDPAHDELLNSWRTEIRGWLYTGDPNERQEITLYGVSSEALLENVIDICEELGIKIRFEWHAASQILAIRIPSNLHELIWAELGRYDIIAQDRLRQAGVTPCGLPRVTNIGSTDITLENGDKLRPDGSLKISFLTGGQSTAVVFEVASSQSLPSALRKACKYLWLSNDAIRAVIVCKMPKRIPTTHTFKVEIGVWVKEAPINPGIQRLNPCLFVPNEEGAQHALPMAMADEWSDGRLGATGPLFDTQAPDGTILTIRRRNSQPIIIFDEALNGVQPLEPTLRLHVYDFIRPCNQYPDGRVPEELQWIDFPLEPLQELISEKIARHRRTSNA